MLEASLQIRVRSRAVSQLAKTGRHMRRCTIGPTSSGLGEGLAGRDILVPSRSSDSCGGPGTMHAHTVARCFLRHIGVSGFQVKRSLCQEAVRLGWDVFRRMHGLHLSRVRTGVAAMRQDYQLDTTKLGRKKKCFYKDLKYHIYISIQTFYSVLCFKHNWQRLQPRVFLGMTLHGATRHTVI